MDLELNDEQIPHPATASREEANDFIRKVIAQLPQKDQDSISPGHDPISYFRLHQPPHIKAQTAPLGTVPPRIHSVTPGQHTFDIQWHNPDSGQTESLQYWINRHLQSRGELSPVIPEVLPASLNDEELQKNLSSTHLSIPIEHFIPFVHEYPVHDEVTVPDEEEGLVTKSRARHIVENLARRRERLNPGIDRTRYYPDVRELGEEHLESRDKGETSRLDDIIREHTGGNHQNLEEYAKAGYPDYPIDLDEKGVRLPMRQSLAGINPWDIRATTHPDTKLTRGLRHLVVSTLSGLKNYSTEGVKVRSGEILDTKNSSLLSPVGREVLSAPVPDVEESARTLTGTKYLNDAELRQNPPLLGGDGSATVELRTPEGDVVGRTPFSGRRDSLTTKILAELPGQPKFDSINVADGHVCKHCNSIMNPKEALKDTDGLYMHKDTRVCAANGSRSDFVIPPVPAIESPKE